MGSLSFPEFKREFLSDALDPSNKNGKEARILLNAILVNIHSSIERRVAFVILAAIDASPHIGSSKSIDTSAKSFVTNFGKSNAGGQTDFAWELYYYLHKTLSADKRLDEIDRLLLSGDTFFGKTGRRVAKETSSERSNHHTTVGHRAFNNDLRLNMTGNQAVLTPDAQLQPNEVLDQTELQTEVPPRSISEPIPMSLKHGMRIGYRTLARNTPIENFASDVVFENIIFHPNDDFDDLCLKLANTFVQHSSFPEIARKSYEIEKEKLVGQRDAVRNFLGMDRPNIYEFNENKDEPGKNLLGHQRLLASGIDLRNLKSIGAYLLRNISLEVRSITLTNFRIRVLLNFSNTLNNHELINRIKESIPENLNYHVEYLFLTNCTDECKIYTNTKNIENSSENIYTVVYLFLRRHGQKNNYKSLFSFRKKLLEIFTHETQKTTKTDHVSAFKACVRSFKQKSSINYEIFHAIEKNSYFCWRLISFLVQMDFRYLDSAIIEFSRNNSMLRKYLEEFMNEMIINGPFESLSFLTKLQVRIDFLNNIKLDRINTDFAINFVTEYTQNPIENDQISLSYSYYLLSFYSFRQGSIDAAISLCEISLSLFYENYSARCFYSVLLYQNGELQNSFENIILAKQHSGAKYEFAHFYEGVLQEKKSNYADAKLCYLNALMLKPEFYEAAHNLCNCLIIEGRILDASRLAVVQTTVHGAIIPEFMTALSYGLLRSGHAKDARRMLLDSHNQVAAPIFEYNLAVLYFNTSQAAMCNEWINRLFSNPQAPSFILKHASELRKRVRKNEFPKLDEGDLLDVILEDEIDPALSILINKYYGESIFLKNTLLEKIKRAIWSTPRHPTHHMPKSLRQQAEANMTAQDQERRKLEREKYYLAIRRGRAQSEPNAKGRKRRNDSARHLKRQQELREKRLELLKKYKYVDYQYSVSKSGKVEMLLAPSYGGG